jgi:hypothetical protein
MQYPPEVRIVAAPCEGLRWKSMLIPVSGEEKSAEDSEGSNFWCVFTQRSVGPDGEVVSRGTCTPSRSCYKQL